MGDVDDETYRQERQALERQLKELPAGAQQPISVTDFRRGGELLAAFQDCGITPAFRWSPRSNSYRRRSSIFRSTKRGFTLCDSQRLAPRPSPLASGVEMEREMGIEPSTSCLEASFRFAPWQRIWGRIKKLPSYRLLEGARGSLGPAPLDFTRFGRSITLTGKRIPRCASPPRAK